MLLLTKEATDKDRSLKTQLTISSKSFKEKISRERVWRNEGFFKDTNKGNEVKLYTCMYDLQTGEFLGLWCKVALIVFRGDERELLLSYGLDAEKASVLYSSSKQKIPDAFISTSFKKHYSEIMNESRETEDFSTLFYYLPSITDRKEDTNQHRNKVNISPVDFSISFIESFSKNKE